MVFRRAERLGAEQGTNVWGVFTPLAIASQAANLGQGFPTFAVPQYMKDAVAASLASDMMSQYSSHLGLLRLRAAVAGEYSAQFGRSLDAASEVLITQGATEGTQSSFFCFSDFHPPCAGTLACFLSFINPGDEVLVLEPCYDMYAANIGYAGGRPVYVPLRFRNDPDAAVKSSDQWYIDMAELKAAITPRTRAILFNNPHNPMGKVFSLKELEEIRAFVIEHDLIVISDEVVRE